MTRDEVIAASNTAADRIGIPRQLLLAAGIAESNLNPNARRPVNPADDARYWPDISFGAWQQTVRWAAEYLKAVSKSPGDPNRFPGVGTIQTIGELYLDPEHAADVAAANLAEKWNRYQPDMLATLLAYNWPNGGGKPASEAAELNYARGLTEAADILGVAPMPSTPVYNPDTPPERQLQDWVCSIRTATWMLKSLGVPIDAGTMQDMMSPRYVTQADGLLDGRGYGLAEVLRSCLGGTANVSVYEDVSWDELQQMAGTGPVGIGSNSLYHWLPVAKVIDADTLSAPNPAPNYHNIGDQLTHAEFDQWAPWNCVRVETQQEAPPAPSPEPAPPPAVDLSAWINSLAYLGDDQGDIVRAMAAKLRVQADQLDGVADELQRVRGDLVGKRPAA